MLTRGDRWRRGTAAVSACWLAATACAPPSGAGYLLAVGMPIHIGAHYCTLGFFGHNGRGDQLAVTAGHCSDQTAYQQVSTEDGVAIGEVVAWLADSTDSNGKLNGTRGYTIFTVKPGYSVEPYFARVNTAAAKGDYVTKFGERSGKTSGYITGISTVDGRPDLAVMYSTLVQLPGDSGCPWVTTGPALEPELAAMGSSSDQEANGGDAGSQAQPIGALIELIRINSSGWGDGFTVWTQ